MTRSDNLYALPADLPVPVDDGGPDQAGAVRASRHSRAEGARTSAAQISLGPLWNSGQVSA